MTIAALLAVSLCTLWTLAGLVAILSLTRRPPADGRRVAEPTAALPPVSVLKPLCGADPGLEESLASFFTQDYPNAELVFGVESPTDPALDVVARLRGRHPAVACRLVVRRGARGSNPKVRNLTGMLPQASHDLVLVSDSNVRAPAHYLREMVATHVAEPQVGLVTNLFAGVGEDSVGAALEAVQLNGFCAAGATVPTCLGHAAVIGKSMLFSRSLFERLGGFGRVADVLAEDFVMGKMFQHGGYRVRIARTVLTTVTAGVSVRAFFARHLRWGMLRCRLQPLAYLLEPLTSPLCLLPLAGLALGWWAWPWAAALLTVRDVGGWVALRGPRRAWVAALLSPVRELCLLAVWLWAPLKRHVTWRGHRVRVGAGTLLYDSAAAPARCATGVG